MEIFLLWVLLSAAVGVFVSQRRNRNGFGWFLLCLLVSPLIGFAFAAALNPLEEKRGDQSKQDSAETGKQIALMFGLVFSVIAFIIAITGGFK